MWEQTLKRWLDLVFWWLPKQPEPSAPSAAEPASAEPAPGPAKPAPAAAAKPATTMAAVAEQATGEPVADDLTVIKGIGPVVQNKLHALGIRTFGDLAAADPGALTEQLKGRQPISEALVRGWTEAADQQVGARH